VWRLVKLNLAGHLSTGENMGYTSIVCGVTGSAHSQKAALQAALLAKENNASLVYVYAVDATFMRGGITVELTPGCVEDALEKLGDHIVAMAEEIASTQGIIPKKIVRRGSVLEVLRKVVLEEKADLLVLGHENRTFFEKAFFKGDVEDHINELKQQTGVEVNVVR
jgi:nucleotide-binding universal stress UspA family protein